MARPTAKLLMKVWLVNVCALRPPMTRLSVRDGAWKTNLRTSCRDTILGPLSVGVAEVLLRRLNSPATLVIDAAGPPAPLPFTEDTCCCTICVSTSSAAPATEANMRVDEPTSASRPDTSASDDVMLTSSLVASESTAAAIAAMSAHTAQLLYTASQRRHPNTTPSVAQPLS